MGKFLITIDEDNLSAQIASLINMGGQLKFFVSKDSVRLSPISYLVELHKDKVIGTIGLDKKNPKVTELKHLCVHPDYRRQGVGRRLLEKGASSVPTELVYGMVRSDNLVNIRNNLRIGMIPIGKKSKMSYSLIIFARRKNSDRLQKIRRQGI